MIADVRKAVAGIPLVGPVLRSGYRAVQRLFGIMPGEKAMQEARAFRYAMAEKYLRGTGLEVGALHSPLQVPPGTQVKYVDRMDVAGLRKHYPEMKDWNLVEIDVIDNGEKLTTQAAGSQDFIIANHFIEHTQNPIATIQRFLEVLRPGGVIYLAVPDKRWTFDIRRDVTPLDHLYRDYREGPEWSYRQHMQEWVTFVQNLKGVEAEASLQKLIAEDYSIHFHVWTKTELVAMLEDIRKTLKLPFDLADVQTNRPLAENICILKKT